MIKPKGQLELTAHLYVANMVDETQSANGGIIIGVVSTVVSTILSVILYAILVINIA
jgi:hypothetical protein